MQKVDSESEFRAGRPFRWHHARACAGGLRGARASRLSRGLWRGSHDYCGACPKREPCMMMGPCAVLHRDFSRLKPCIHELATASSVPIGPSLRARRKCHTCALPGYVHQNRTPWMQRWRARRVENCPRCLLGECNATLRGSRILATAASASLPVFRAGTTTLDGCTHWHGPGREKPGSPAGGKRRSPSESARPNSGETHRIRSGHVPENV